MAFSMKSRIATIIAVTLLPSVMFLGCHAKDSSKTSQPDAKPYLEKRPSIQASDLPSDFLKAVDTASTDTAVAGLREQRSLELNGTILIVGAVGAHQTLILAANTLKLLNGARIVTNGNNLVIVANNLEFSNSGGINSFWDDSLKAKGTKNGSDGGRVEIFATKGVRGSILVTLSGQVGGAGVIGATGATGPPGPKGNDAVNGPGYCSSGGQNGGPGGTGGDGLKGSPGAAGGAGGDFVLRASAIPGHDDHFSFQSVGAIGGTGGEGGPGGQPGTVGQGGSGSTFCGGGGPGGPGRPGNTGPKGDPGANSKVNGKLLLEQ